MDSSAVFGLIGALLGSLVGAAGSYWATVGGSRSQSRARLQAAYRAIRGRLEEEQAEESRERERLLTLRTRLQDIALALNAARRNEAAQLPGLSGADPSTLPPDAPAARLWLRSHLTSFGLTGHLPSTWLSALAPDVGLMDPGLYNALSAYESVLGYVNTFVQDTTADLLHFADELQIEDDLTLHELAQHGQLPRVTGRFKLRVESLHNMIDSLAQTRAEVLRLLPAAITRSSATPGRPASPAA